MSSLGVCLESTDVPGHTSSVWLTPTPWIIADFVDSDAVSMGLRKG